MLGVVVAYRTAAVCFPHHLERWSPYPIYYLQLQVRIIFKATKRIIKKKRRRRYFYGIVLLELIII